MERWNDTGLLLLEDVTEEPGLTMAEWDGAPDIVKEVLSHFVLPTLPIYRMDAYTST
ncbi:hypothetical protein Hanom_Chr11g01051911 [Helianthus anomalus]